MAHLGELENLVLAAALRLGPDAAYGAAIIEEIRARTGRRVPAGSAYVTLDRLERKRFVVSRYADPDFERGGRPKRYVEVTPAGTAAARANLTAILNMWRGLDLLAEDQ